MALAWGVAFGGIAQLALQIRPLAKLGMLPRPSFRWRDEGVTRVLRAMGPALLGVSAAQISALINTQLAAWLGDGDLVDPLCVPPDGFPERAARRGIGTVLSLRSRSTTATRPRRYSDLLDWGWARAMLALPAHGLWLIASR